MNNASVVISGMGAVSAAGINLHETIECFSAGCVNAAETSLFNTTLKVPVFEVSGIPSSAHAEKDRTLFLALHAVNEALTDAGLERGNLGVRVGVCLGTTVACQLNDMDFYRAYRATGAVDPGPVDRYLKNNLADAVAKAIDAEGPILTLVNACSSGTDAIGAGLSLLRAGVCDIVVAGGADELNRIPLCGFNSLSVLSPAVCAPFDRDRQGLNLGEGAGILVLESSDSAAKRGIESNLRLAGYGSAADAYHLTAPRPDGSGLESAIRRALAEADTEPQEVCFVNAHGTSTRDNDKVEGSVLARVFGSDIPVLSTKGFTGHTLGAAGGLEAVFACAALREGWIPASPGFRNKDDEISLSPVTQRTKLNGSTAVSTSLAFGGNNAALVMRKQT